MSLHNWIHSNVEYGRKLACSGLRGVGEGEEDFLQGRPLAPFLAHAAIRSTMVAAAGVCLGAVGGYLTTKTHPARRAILCALGGGVLGLGAGFAWGTRHLAARATDTALRGMGAVREERWWKQNPIDYA